MGHMWLNNSASDRVKRLALKLGSSPFLPTVAVGKLIESLVAGQRVVPWAIVAVVVCVWYVVAEDFVEYASQQYSCIQDALDDL